MSTMTEKEREELEALTGEERARRWSHTPTFALDKEHMDIVCNLFADDDAGNIKLGKILRDLVAFNTGSDLQALLANGDKNDRQDRSARRILQKDALALQDSWLLISLQGTKNRQGKTKAVQEAPEAESTNSTTENGRPTLEEVVAYTNMCLGGVNASEQEQIARQWYNKVTKNHWCDQNGEPIREWRTVFEKYATKAWTGKAIDKMSVND